MVLIFLLFISARRKIRPHNDRTPTLNDHISVDF